MFLFFRAPNNAGELRQGGAFLIGFADESHQRSMAVAATYDFQFKAISRPPRDADAPIVKQRSRYRIFYDEAGRYQGREGCT
jgi:hypothetical protein